MAFGLGYAAGEAANRRCDARVLLLSLAFMATGGFMGLHAIGTPGVLFSEGFAGFQVAISVGLLVSAVFAAGSAFVDVSPGIGPLLMRRRTLLQAAVLIVMGVWFVWTVVKLPPLHNENSEAATGSLLAVLAIVGTIVYAVCAARYWSIFRHRRALLPLAVIACFVLLAEGTNLTTRFAPRVPPWPCSGSLRVLPSTIRTGLACASASTAAKRWFGRSEATAISRTPWSATRSTPASAWRVSPQSAGC